MAKEEYNAGPKAAVRRHCYVVHELDPARVSRSILFHAALRSPRILWLISGVAILFLAALLDLVVGFPFPRLIALVVLVLFAILTTPLLRIYRDKVRAFEQRWAAGRTYCSNFESDSFTIDTSEGSQRFLFADFETIKREGSYTALVDAKTGNIMSLPEALFPGSEIDRWQASARAVTP